MNKTAEVSFRRAAETRSPRRPLTSPLVDKDLPALYTLQFESAVLHPRIIFQFFSHFIFIFSIEDQQRATFINQRATHQNKTVGDELIDKRRVFVPKGLLTRAFRKITVRACRRKRQECIFHYIKVRRPRVASIFRVVCRQPRRSLRSRPLHQRRRRVLTVFRWQSSRPDRPRRSG